MSQETKKDLVVILHGIGMTPLRMIWLSWRLKMAGYETLNLSYPSLKKDISGCAMVAMDKIERRVHDNGVKIHIVGHSMGGLVALELLQQNKIKNIGRAVMIAPPFWGSEVADKLFQNYFYKLFFGPAGQQLTTAFRKTCPNTIPAGVEVGVIAGARAYEYPFFLKVMRPSGVHDGLVSLKSTQINGIKDSVTIRASHSFLIEISASQTVHFLKHGRFQSKTTRAL